MRYAVIEEGICTNVIEADGAFAAEIGAVPLPEGYGIGDSCTDGVWKVAAVEIDVEAARAAKHTELSEVCQAVIYGGVTFGGKQYSLTDHDQAEIMAQLSFVKEGAAAVPYHANGELCRMVPAEEFAGIAQAATAHIFYHRTYCNHLFAWLRRADYDEFGGITYGAALPEDLAENMRRIVEAAS
ncbi:hypothetical protein LJC32_02640 [Oscillospiraceae bacterium OttesenSCG-928-F05]|nr:hypothetical protein [Oscillospiraceae bacterium OttesenSCG-928-F05]